MNKPFAVGMNRAYSLLTVKRVDAQKRQLEGIATTPTPDRLGDIIEPLGIEFKNPTPLLWQHHHDKPVGNVKFGKPTEDGMAFTAQLPLNVENATIRERVEEAWESVKLGLVRGVSIGFVPREWNFMKDGGLRIEKSEVIELSLVTIPANTEATILEIKSAALKAEWGAADGKAASASVAPIAVDAVDLNHALASEPVTVKSPASRGTIAARPQAQEKKMPRTIAEQLSAYEAKRAANVARMAAIMSKSDEEGQTLDTSSSEEYDTLDQENAGILAHLTRLKKLDELNKLSAITVDPIAEQRKTNLPAELRQSVSPLIRVKANVPQGTSFTRLAMAMAAGRGQLYESIRFCKQAMASGGWDNTPEVLKVLEEAPDIGGMLKAAVGAGTTTDATWASPLVAYQIMAGEFIELLRPATIIGRIPGLRRVPFNIQMPATTTGSSVAWVGENAPKPVSAMAFTTVQLRWAKAAGIVVLTDELVRFSNPSAEAVVRGDLIAAMAQFLDRQFVDPAIAEITNVSPASITNGVTPVTASGTNQAAFATDAKTMFNTFLTNNLSASGGVWIGTQQQALSFSLMLNALGQPFYPTMTGEGGTLLGYPFIASENIPPTGGSPADGYPLIFAKAPEIMLADDGQTVIDASNQASVQMDSAPDSPPTAATTLVSLWQMNMTGLRAERWINWKKRRATAVAFIQFAKYG